VGLGGGLVDGRGEVGEFVVQPADRRCGVGYPALVRVVVTTGAVTVDAITVDAVTVAVGAAGVAGPAAERGRGCWPG
jgi:hypothetical protein